MWSAFCVNCWQAHTPHNTFEVLNFLCVCKVDLSLTFYPLLSWRIKTSQHRIVLMVLSEWLWYFSYTTLMGKRSLCSPVKNEVHPIIQWFVVELWIDTTMSWYEMFVLICNAGHCGQMSPFWCPSTVDCSRSLVVFFRCNFTNLTHTALF